MHGITVDHGKHVTIRDNVLINNGDQGRTSMINVPVINVSNLSVDVDIIGNRVASVPDARNGWTVSGNTTTNNNIKHWVGNYGNGQPAAAGAAEATGAASSGANAARPAADDVSDIGSGSPIAAVADVFRLNGRIAGDGPKLVDGIDFSDDKIVFNNFDDGTFSGKGGGNPVQVWRDGGAVRIDSAVDLQEIVASSRGVSASVRGEDLILRIAQDDGVAQVVLADLADEFRAADQPDLF
jgi:hypothetical protein